jgi:hypothetical protein
VNITGSVTGEITIKRTSSSALTVASDSGVENEKLLAEHQVLNNLSNSNKILSDSPVNSGRNSPTLTYKRRQHLFRSSTTTATPTSLANESPLLNHSLT